MFSEQKFFLMVKWNGNSLKQSLLVMYSLEINRSSCFRSWQECPVLPLATHRFRMLPSCNLQNFILQHRHPPSCLSLIEWLPHQASENTRNLSFLGFVPEVCSKNNWNVIFGPRKHLVYYTCEKQPLSVMNWKVWLPKKLILLLQDWYDSIDLR